VAPRSRLYMELWEGRAPPEALDEFPSLPLSTKDQLRTSQAHDPPFGTYLAAPTDRATRLHRTSGTTGQAMNLALSERDCTITEVVGGRCHRAAGLTPAHTAVHCLSYQMWMGGVTDPPPHPGKDGCDGGAIRGGRHGAADLHDHGGFYRTLVAIRKIYRSCTVS
jgi:phenylacetate-CoA ligase